MQIHITEEGNFWVNEKMTEDPSIAIEQVKAEQGERLVIVCAPEQVGSPCVDALLHACIEHGVHRFQLITL